MTRLPSRNPLVFSQLRILLTAFMPIIFSGCVYSKVIYPLDTDVNQTHLGQKIGRASSQSFFWLVATGDGGVEAAAKDGNITVINHLDVERYMLFFGAYVRVTTIAYGD